MLRHLGQHPTWDTENRLWLSFLYTAYYHIGSALDVFSHTETCSTPSEARLKRPTGIDRRGLRHPSLMFEHIDSWSALADAVGTQEAWLRADFTEDPLANFWSLQDKLQQVRYNGRWAAFTLTEILKTVHDWPIAFPDMRLEQSSGPREGLAWLYRTHKTTDVRVLDGYGEDLSDRLAAEGLPLPWERLESVLCDFNNVRQGRYYIGKRIDGQQMQCSAPFLTPMLQTLLWQARASTIPLAYLGEKRGWYGVDHARERVYRDTGHILIRTV